MSTAPARTSSMSMCPSVRFFASVAASILPGCGHYHQEAAEVARVVAVRERARRARAELAHERARARDEPDVGCAGANVRIECCVELGGIAWYSSASAMCSADALSSVTPTWRVESKPIVYPLANLNGVAPALEVAVLVLDGVLADPVDVRLLEEVAALVLRARHAAQYGSPLNSLSTQ